MEQASTAPRRRRMSPARRRRQIVDAAGVIFETRDPLEVTFEEVAETAGVSRGLVYRYFGDKGGLVAAVYLRSSQRFDAAIESALDGAVDPHDRLTGMVRTYFRLAEANAGAFRRFASLASVHHPKVEAAREQRLRRIAARWGDTEEAAVVARAVVTMLESTALDWLDRHWPDLDRTAEMVATLLWGGVSTFSQAGTVTVPGPRGALPD